jgi:hypothetical protein
MRQSRCERRQEQIRPDLHDRGGSCALHSVSGVGDAMLLLFSRFGERLIKSATTFYNHVQGAPSGDCLAPRNTRKKRMSLPSEAPATARPGLCIARFGNPTFVDPQITLVASPSNHLNLLKNAGDRRAARRDLVGSAVRKSVLSHLPSLPLASIGISRRNGCLAGEGGPVPPERRTPQDGQTLTFPSKALDIRSVMNYCFHH